MPTDSPETVTTPNTEHARGRGRELFVVEWVFPGAARTRVTGTVVVGRDETKCQTVLLGDEISRAHAVLSGKGLFVLVKDNESRNGVFVNGIRRAESPLVPGDVLRLGEWVGIVGTEPEPSPGQAEIAPGFRQIAPRLFGGRALALALEPLKRLGNTTRVVVQGETGTGKEDAARAIHEASGRKGELVALNCAVVTGSLAEDQLFGHARGAFHGADRESPGLFRAAHRGTLFLDEVLELSQEAQAKLLRVIDTGRVRPLGETKEEVVDVGIVAAAQGPLEAAVVAGRFRRDLYERLNGHTVVLPPLRERREDIVPLFRLFAERHPGRAAPRLEPKLVETLCRYRWPGNVRELLLRTTSMINVHGHEPMLKRAHLPEEILRAVEPASPTGPVPVVDSSAAIADAGAKRKSERKSTADLAEQAALDRALEQAGGSPAKAAELMGVSRARVNRLLEARKKR